jgi:UDPglucose--hexose-1-phosphate uridylyltransferase
MLTNNFEKKEQLHSGAELRHDLLRDEWVIIADKRAKRPQDFVVDDEKEKYDPDNDVFADPEKSGQEKDTLIYRNEDGEWTTRVIPNKFPTVEIGGEDKDLSEGPYHAMQANGYHEVLITRDGHRTFALLESNELAEVIDAYRERYLELMNKRSISSVTIFHNHGKKSGASVMHPHSQILALPVVMPAIAREITACEKYTKHTKEHLFAIISEFELERGERIVYTNDQFIVYCPFASSRAFQMRIIPREPAPYFERISDKVEFALADALSHALRSIYIGLSDPDFNYYIHTAPCDGRTYDNYSYYIDIIPRTHIYGGFEFATDVEVVPMRPENAAQFLRDTLDENGV